MKGNFRKMQPKRSHIKSILALLLLASLGVCCLAQSGNLKYKIKRGEVVVKLRKDQSTIHLDSTLCLLGTSLQEVDSLCEKAPASPEVAGWQLSQCTGEYLEFRKAIKDFKAPASTQFDALYLDTDLPISKKGQAPYGTNAPNLTSVTGKGGQTIFRLPGYLDAQDVILSGTFNHWSTTGFAMVKKDGFWEATVSLDPGEHRYKFIIDGEWIPDPGNPALVREYDGYVNSVWFKTNHHFSLPGHLDAQDVFVAGDFNQWSTRELQMSKVENGWALPVFLEEGNYSYKFLLDGQWLSDPNNPDQQPDQFGGTNSRLHIGTPATFILPGYEQAKQVVVTGDFVEWDHHELPMAFSEGAWRLSYPLPPGNYTYKFIVDGKWISDPGNPHTVGHEPFVNSILPVQPNHTFIVPLDKKSADIRISGTFNEWLKEGYALEFMDDHWEISLYLPAGKNLYKYIVKDQWIHDPSNQYWEVNEYGGKNSVLWIE